MSSSFGQPLDGSFTWPRTYHQRRPGGHVHQGLDFNVPEGRKWLAVADGVIEQVVRDPGENFGGYGRVCVLRFVDADGETLRALYAHGKSIAVESGQTVRKGDVLGTVGRSQFRTKRQLERSRIPVPQNYTRDMDDNGRVARASTGRGMGAHLHFELSRRAYPVGSEANVRVDPRAWAEARSLVPASTRRAPDAAPRLAQATTRRTVPHQVRNPDDALVGLRRDLMTRVMLTDTEVTRVTTALRAPNVNLPVAADALRAAWDIIRDRLIPMLRVTSPEADIRATVEGWLEQVRRLRDAALAQGHSVAQTIADRLERIWRGVRWAGGLALASAGMAGGGAILLLIALAVFMGGGQYMGAKYAYRRYVAPARRR